MKCPIPFVTLAVDSFPPDYERRECLKKECAWWESNIGKCSVLRMWIALQDIHEVLHDIEKKMPTEVSFRK